MGHDAGDMADRGERPPHWVLANVQQGDQDDRMIRWIDVGARRTNAAALLPVVAEIRER